MSAALVLRRVEVEGRTVDVVAVDGVVRAVGPGVADGPDVDHVDHLEEVDGRGGALFPGLHDHHVHLLAMAARSAGLDLDPLPDPASVDAALHAAAVDAAQHATQHATADSRAPRPPEPVPVSHPLGCETGTGSSRGWVRAGGYDEHRHGPLDRWRLDAVAPGVAVRVQHRSGLAWALSSAGLGAVGLLGHGTATDGVERDASGEPTGWLHRLDRWLGDRVPRAEPDLAAVARRLAGYGITGVTDATHDIGAQRLGLLRAAARSGALPQRVVVLGADDPHSVEGWARLGPLKLLADESLGLDPERLAGRVRAAHARGRAVAVHAVTRAENVTAVTALELAGARPGDRIEHGSVLPRELDPFLAAAGVTVVVQPSLVAERGDHHLAEVEAPDLPLLHRHASLLAAGVRVGVGSDAPVTSPDPWAGVRAASTRATRTGAVVGPSEAVAPGVALGWYLADPLDPGGPPRRVVPGAPADLCLLDAPLAEVLDTPDAGHVRATWIGGTLVRP